MNEKDIRNGKFVFVYGTNFIDFVKQVQCKYALNIKTLQKQVWLYFIRTTRRPRHMCIATNLQIVLNTQKTSPAKKMLAKFCFP